MNLPDSLLAVSWYVAGWLGLGLLLVLALWRGNWRQLAEPGRLNVWLGNCVVLMLMWSMKAGVLPGLNLHLLGAMALTLEFGPAMAFVASLVVLGGITLNGAAGWLGFGVNGLLMGAVPVALSYLVWRVGERYLPKNIFVFIFFNGFFGAALVVLGSGTLASLFLLAAGAYSYDVLSESYLPYFLLLGFSEAWLTGMVMTLMIVYKPGWVRAFDDAKYLAKQN